MIALRQQAPSWGKQRLADELAKANGWVPLVSASTVQRILHAAGLLPEPAPPGKKSSYPASSGVPRHPT